MKVIEKRSNGNSTVRFVKHGEKIYVEKDYHRKFNIDDETEGYKELNEVLENVKHVRACNVIRVIRENNIIRLEYVDCPLLYKELFTYGYEYIQHIADTVVKICIKSKKIGYTFDLDPKNIFVCCGENKPFLVIIDPPCIDTNIDDHNAVVFFIGILKSFVRYGLYRPIKGISIIKFFVKEYTLRSEVPIKRFMGQAARYARIVASWNYDPDEAGGESILGIRRVVLSAAWMVVSGVLLSIGFVSGRGE